MEWFVRRRVGPWRKSWWDHGFGPCLSQAHWFRNCLKWKNDHVFEIGLTPNRADAMSHWGVARDLRAGLIKKNPKELITPSTSNFHVDNRTLKIDVAVENSDLAPRYCGITIGGLKWPNPTWLQNRLKSIGLSPINNIVDVTNYILRPWSTATCFWCVKLTRIKW